VNSSEDYKDLKSLETTRADILILENVYTRRNWRKSNYDVMFYLLFFLTKLSSFHIAFVLSVQKSDAIMM